MSRLMNRTAAASLALTVAAALSVAGVAAAHGSGSSLPTARPLVLNVVASGATVSRHTLELQGVDGLAGWRDDQTQRQGQVSVAALFEHWQALGFAAHSPRALLVGVAHGQARSATLLLRLVSSGAGHARFAITFVGTPLLGQLPRAGLVIPLGHAPGAVSPNHGACTIGTMVLLPELYHGMIQAGYLAANGQTLKIYQHATLYSLIGTTYGGNGTTTFALPKLAASEPGTVWGICSDVSPNIFPTQGIPSACTTDEVKFFRTGSWQLSDSDWVPANGKATIDLTSSSHARFALISQASGSSVQAPDVPDPGPNVSAFLCVGNTDEYWPNNSSDVWWLASYHLFGYYGPAHPQVFPAMTNQQPRALAPADGRTLLLSSNTALYAILGNRYGGSEQVNTFALPNLDASGPADTIWTIITYGVFPTPAPPS